MAETSASKLQPYGEQLELLSPRKERFPLRLRVIGALVWIPSLLTCYIAFKEPVVMVSMSSSLDRLAFLSLFASTVASGLQILAVRLWVHVLTLALIFLVLSMIVETAQTSGEDDDYWVFLAASSAVAVFTLAAQISGWFVMRRRDKR